jgi:hypothetical protein
MWLVIYPLFICLAVCLPILFVSLHTGTAVTLQISSTNQYAPRILWDCSLIKLLHLSPRYFWTDWYIIYLQLYASGHFPSVPVPNLPYVALFSQQATRAVFSSTCGQYSKETKSANYDVISLRTLLSFSPYYTHTNASRSVCQLQK